MKKICKTCNKEFNAKNYNQNYCSEKCRNVAVTRKCERCGKEFKVSKPSIQTKFCSKSCSVATMNELKILGSGSKNNKNKNKVKLKCDHCGKEFEKVQSEYAKEKKKNFCCKECYDEYCKNITTTQYDKKEERFCEYCGKKLPDTYEGRIHKYCNQECYSKAKRKRTKLKCDYCGKEFEKIPSLVNKNLNFCCKECGSLYRLRARFNKDLKFSQFRNRLRISKEYKNWEKEVLKKDNHKCKICNSQKDLHVHHIIPVSNIIHSYKNNNDYDLELYDKVTNDSLFNNINNGITLCSNCHNLCHNFGDNFLSPNTKK